MIHSCTQHRSTPVSNWIISLGEELLQKRRVFFFFWYFLLWKGVKSYFGNVQVDNVHFKVLPKVFLFAWTPIFVLLSMAGVGRRYTCVGVCVILVVVVIVVCVVVCVGGLGG